jgi:hypothetical protein
MDHSSKDSTGELGSARLPYARPHLGRVRLEAEQVLDAGCKLTPDGPGLGPSQCIGGGCHSNTGTS